MEVRMLGPLAVEVAGRAVHLPGQQRRLLAALVLHAGCPVTIDALAGAVWDGGAPALARRQVQNHVSALRGLLGRVGSSLAIVADKDAYTLHIQPGQLDRWVFDELVGAGRQTAAGGDVRGAAEHLRAALKLWRGPALDGIGGETLARDAAALDAVRDLVTEEWLELQIMAGRHREVAGELTRLVAAHPLREGPVRLLMVVLARLDRRAEAIAHYRSLAARLRTELGIEPGAALTKTHKAIAGHHFDAATVPRQLPGTVRLLIGRERELQALDEAIGATGLVVLTGPAGVGTSGLALHWAHRNAAAYPDGGLYVNLRGYSPSSPLTAAEALRILNATGETSRSTTTDNQVADQATGKASHSTTTENEADRNNQADRNNRNDRNDRRDDQASRNNEADRNDRDDRRDDQADRNEQASRNDRASRNNEADRNDEAAVNEASHRSALAGKRMILVLDNAADAAQVLPLLPGAPGCAVIVATRRPLPELTVERDASHVEVGPLAPTDSLRLLAGMLRAPLDPADEPLARTLTELCGHLPQHIRVAGANLHDAGPAALAEQVDRLRQRRQAVLAPATFYYRIDRDPPGVYKNVMPPLYYLERTATAPRLVVWDPHTPEPTLLATLPAAAIDTANLSPDLRWLSWVDAGELYVRDLTGAQPERILHEHVDGLLFPPVWTHDSRRVLVRALDGTAGTVDAGSGRFAALPADLSDAAHPMYSVCGQALSWLAADGTLLIADPDGRNPRPVPVPPQLAEDGRRIHGVQVFAPHDFALYTAPADTPIGARSLVSNAYLIGARGVVGNQRVGDRWDFIGVDGATRDYVPYQLRFVPPETVYGFEQVRRGLRGRYPLSLLGGNGEYRCSATEPPMLQDFLLLTA
ncbi:BTAD domain-containing putative transcriptional regulator [Dactylosporangium sp. CS-047395]|uniref:AfsR/SARP family transcriptional regulator n=1 Tax=Dactylosporangium sp. CS-047395 TaxID=3239936 RepID=UPI003D8C4585